MKIKTFDVTDLLFNHSPSKMSFVPDMEIPETSHRANCYSSLRTSNARPGIKTSGITKFFDYLLDSKDDSVCLYCSLPHKVIYLEAVSSSRSMHALITNDKIRVYEPYENQRWHLLPLVAAKWILTPGNNLFAWLRKFQSDINSGKVSIDSKEYILRFTDEFYYFGKHINELNDVKINFEDNTVLNEVSTAFRNGMFTAEHATHFGKRKSAFAEANIPQESKDNNQDAKNNYKKLWEDIKNGKYVLDYSWRNDLREYIKPLSFLDKYVPDRLFWQTFSIFKIRTQKALARIKEAEEKGLPVPEAKKEDCLNIFLHGRAGTGKSYMLYALSAAFGIPAPFTNCSKGTEEDTYEGITKVVDGKLTEIETAMIKVSQDGGMWIGEEFDLTDPEVNKGVFNQLTEYPYIAMKNGYQPIKRHPLAIFAATFNVGEQSPRMDSALSSRFVPSLRFKDPTKEDFIGRMIASGAKDETATWVYNSYVRILNLLKDPDINGEECEEYIVPRLCIDACNLIDKDEVEPAIAVEMCMINKIAEVRPDVADEIYTMLDSYF